MTYIFILTLLLFLEIGYFMLAAKLNIIDKPNHRSSHEGTIIRGGGIIFSIAAILYYFLHDLEATYFTLGLFLISLISLLDDIFTLSNRVRIIVHLAAVYLMFYQLGISAMPWYTIIFAGVLTIGTINAYNFMDGINGITGSYSLITLSTILYLSYNVVPIVSLDFLCYIGMALLVFNFFNFRKQAKCFAGDIGSVSIAFIVVFLIGKMIIVTGNYNYIFLLLIYGLDTVTTIIFRLLRSENIFEAHRRHFYQFLVNEKKMPHLWVATGYALSQLLFNLLFLSIPSVAVLPVALLCSTVFIICRFIFEGTDRLIKKPV